MYTSDDTDMTPPSTRNIENTSRDQSFEPASSVYLIGDNGVICLPMPSQSPRDPLNWSKIKTAMAFAALAWFSVVGLVLVQASLMFIGLEAEYNTAQTVPHDINVLISGPILFMGVGAFLWVPMSLAIGRRAVFLLATLFVTFGTLWAGMSQNIYQLLAAVCVIGLAEGFATSTMLLAVIDLTFIHQRPQAIAMFWSLFGFTSLIIFSFVPWMSANGAHRRVFYLGWAIPCIVSTILAYFFFPETYFIRPGVAFNGRVLFQSSTEQAHIYDHWDEVLHGKALPDTPEISHWFFTHKEYAIVALTPGGWKECLRCYPQIILCLMNPLIFWVALLEAVTFGSMLTIGATYSLILSAPPYNFNATSITFVNLAGALGCLFAWPMSGWLIAHVVRKLAIHNKGVREAEHYLPAFILPVCFSASSLFLYGATAHFGLHSSFVYASYFLNSFAFSGLATANTLWVTEAFPRWAAPAIVVVNGFGYIGSFGTSFAILPWMKSQGILLMECELGIAVMLVGCIGLTWVFWGKQLRGSIEGRWAVSQAGALRPR